MISFKRLNNNGESTISLSLKAEDVTTDNLAKLFKLNKESIFITNDSNEVIFPENAKFINLYADEYYVNGDMANLSVATPLTKITNTLDSRGLPAPLNVNRCVGGFESNSLIRTNNVVPTLKSFKKTLTRISCVNNALQIIQNIPITLNEKTASVPKVLEILKNDLSFEDPVVVDYQNMEILDSVHTRGASFWKGSRKISFIERKDFLRFNQNKKSKSSKRRRQSNEDVIADDESDTSSDVETTLPKFNLRDNQEILDKLTKQNDLIQRMEIKIGQLDKISTCYDQIKKFISTCQDGAHLKIFHNVKSFFNCIICYDVTKDEHPRVTMCCNSCCCSGCLSKWKLTNDSCPACRRAQPLLLPLQIKGAIELCAEVRKMPDLDHQASSITESLISSDSFNSLNNSDLPSVQIIN